MSGEIPERVTCEVCGTSFDPAESRGWCPNAACGKWQHPAFPLSNDADAGRVGAADGGVDTPTKVCPSCGKDVRADANFCKFCSHQFPDDAESGARTGTGASEPGIDECPSCGADLSSIPPDRLADCPICGTGLGDVLADHSEPDLTPADLADCPACSADLTDIPEDMRMVCPNCRIDLREAIEQHGTGGDAGAEAPGGQPAAGAGGQGGGQQAGGQTGGGQGAGGGQQADQANAQAAGQAGGDADAAAGDTGDAGQANVDTIKGIGASYAERLSNAGIDTVGELVLANPEHLSAATDISESRIREWVERADVDPADVGQLSADAGSDAGDAAGADAADDPGQTAAGGQGAGQASARSGGQADAQGAGQTDAGGTGGANARGGGQGTAQSGGQRNARSGGQSPGQAGGQAGAGGQSNARKGGQANAGTAGDPHAQRADSATGRQSGQTGNTGTAGGTGQPHDPGVNAGVQPSYDTVVLTVMGQEIRARPGDTLGREIRTAMVESGADDNDAVYIHREHLRVDKEGDTFYFTRLGQNSLKVNDQPVPQNERVEVSDGDVVSFSEVVSADVRLE